VGAVGCFLVASSAFWEKAASDDTEHSGMDGDVHFLLSVAGSFFWLAKSGKNVISQPVQSSRAMSHPAVPTLSALQGQAPQVNFNAHEWFRAAYYSPLTAEIENNIKIAANNNQPTDREGFYARLIGVGMIAYFHDMTWAYIFKSQLVMLAELNRWVMISASDAKAFYDKAVMEYPKIYANYSFDQWLNFMKAEQLLIQHPSNMLEITHRGKDLLKYLAHWGRDAAVKTG